MKRQPWAVMWKRPQICLIGLKAITAGFISCRTVSLLSQINTAILLNLKTMELPGKAISRNGYLSC